MSQCSGYFSCTYERDGLDHDFFFSSRRLTRILWRTANNEPSTIMIQPIHRILIWGKTMACITMKSLWLSLCSAVLMVSLLPTLSNDRMGGWPVEATFWVHCWCRNCDSSDFAHKDGENVIDLFGFGVFLPPGLASCYTVSWLIRLQTPWLGSQHHCGRNTQRRCLRYWSGARIQCPGAQSQNPKRRCPLRSCTYE